MRMTEQRLREAIRAVLREDDINSPNTMTDTEKAAKKAAVSSGDKGDVVTPEQAFALADKMKKKGAPDSSVKDVLAAAAVPSSMSEMRRAPGKDLDMEDIHDIFKPPAVDDDPLASLKSEMIEMGLNSKTAFLYFLNSGLPETLAMSLANLLS